MSSITYPRIYRYLENREYREKELSNLCFTDSSCNIKHGRTQHVDPIAFKLCVFSELYVSWQTPLNTWPEPSAYFLSIQFPLSSFRLWLMFVEPTEMWRMDSEGPSSFLMVITLLSLRVKAHREFHKSYFKNPNLILFLLC